MSNFTSGTNTLGNGTLAAAYLRIGKLIHFRITLTWGSTTSSTGVDWVFSPPEAPATGMLSLPIGTTIMLDTGVSEYLGDCRFLTTTQLQCRALNTASTYALPTGVTNAIPFTWGNTDVMRITGCYESV